MEKTFSEIMRDLILESGLSIPKLCKRLEIPRRTLQNWEYGTATPPIYLQKAVIQEMKRIIRETDREKLAPNESQKTAPNKW